jgi:hypothetical protein
VAVRVHRGGVGELRERDAAEAGEERVGHGLRESGIGDRGSAGPDNRSPIPDPPSPNSRLPLSSHQHVRFHLSRSGR